MCVRPPWPAYSPSVFSRMMTQSRFLGFVVVEVGGGSDAAQDAGGANIGVVLEGLDEGKTEGPEGYVVWDV